MLRPSARAALRAALPASRAEALALLAPFAVYLALSALLGAWIIDDAGITFAYARSVAHGYGLVSQPGRPPVEGFSDFLWMVLFVPFFAVRLFHPVLVPKVVGALCVLASFRAAQRAMLRATGGLGAGAAVALLFAGSPPLVIWSTSGLENGLLLFLVTLLYALAVEKPARWRLWAGVTCGLVAMTRPEGITMGAAGLAIALGEPVAERASARDGARAGLEYLRGLATVLVPFFAFRLAVFEHVWPHPYYAKRTFLDAAERWSMFDASPELVTAKLADAATSLAGRAGTWVLAAIGLAVAWLAWRRELRAPVGAAAAILVTSLATFVWMDEDWMGELRFGTPVVAAAWLTAVSAAWALTGEALGGRLRRALVPVLAAAGVALACLGAARVARFAARPPTPYADVDRQYARKINAYADALGVQGGSVLAPDGGAMLMDCRLRVYDLSGLFEPDVVHTLKHDGTRWLFAHPDFDDWVFEKAKPTFLVTHDFFTYVSALDRDPRLLRDYAPVDAYVDRYVEAVYGPDLRSGIYVRKDVLRAPEDVDRARDAYHPPPRLDPLVTRLAEALALDPGGPHASDVELRAEAMAARYERQDPERAATLFERLALRRPDDLEARVELADALDAAGRADEARPSWVKALALASARRDSFQVQRADSRLRGSPPSDAEQASLMQAGLDALYAQHDAARAVGLFRQVLALNPRHYGASYQLAAALDAAGRRDEARAQWSTVLRMATDLHDEKTAADVAARLAAGG